MATITCTSLIPHSLLQPVRTPVTSLCVRLGRGREEREGREGGRRKEEEEEEEEGMYYNSEN